MAKLPALWRAVGHRARAELVETVLRGTLVGVAPHQVVHVHRVTWAVGSAGISLNLNGPGHADETGSIAPF
jgi:hypothetical protein